MNAINLFLGPATADRYAAVSLPGTSADTWSKGPPGTAAPPPGFEAVSAQQGAVPIQPNAEGLQLDLLGKTLQLAFGQPTQASTLGTPALGAPITAKTDTTTTDSGKWSVNDVLAILQSLVPNSLGDISSFTPQAAQKAVAAAGAPPALQLLAGRLVSQVSNDVLGKPVTATSNLQALDEKALEQLMAKFGDMAAAALTTARTPVAVPIATDTPSTPTKVDAVVLPTSNEGASTTRSTPESVTSGVPANADSVKIEADSLLGNVKVLDVSELPMSEAAAIGVNVVTSPADATKVVPTETPTQVPESGPTISLKTTDTDATKVVAVGQKGNNPIEQGQAGVESASDGSIQHVKPDATQRGGPPVDGAKSSKASGDGFVLHVKPDANQSGNSSQKGSKGDSSANGETIPSIPRGDEGGQTLSRTTIEPEAGESDGTQTSKIAVSAAPEASTKGITKTASESEVKVAETPEEPVKAKAQASTSAAETQVRANETTQVKGKPELSIDATKQVVRRVNDTLDDLIATRKPQATTILLQPNDLGEVTVKVRSFGPRFDAEITASNETVRNALQQNRTEFLATVEKRGLTVGNLDVTKESAGRSFQSYNQGQQQQPQGQPMRQEYERLMNVWSAQDRGWVTATATGYTNQAAGAVDYTV